MRRVPWIALGLLIAIPLGWAALQLHLQGLLWVPPCPFKAITGLPCASCGLTRCATALVQGRWGEAFHWHPVGTLGLLLLPILGILDGWRVLRGADYPTLPENNWARWAMVGVLTGTWLLQVARGI